MKSGIIQHLISVLDYILDLIRKGEVNNCGCRLNIIEYLNEQFLEWSDLIKLVHIQTYAKRMIPHLVYSIESLHGYTTACENILMTIEDHSVLVFNSLVLAYVVSKYPIEK